jgi:hypothetical protein
MAFDTRFYTDKRAVSSYDEATSTLTLATDLPWFGEGWGFVANSDSATLGGWTQAYFKQIAPNKIITNSDSASYVAIHTGLIETHDSKEPRFEVVKEMMVLFDISGYKQVPKKPYTPPTIVSKVRKYSITAEIGRVVSSKADSVYIEMLEDELEWWNDHIGDFDPETPIEEESGTYPFDNYLRRVGTITEDASPQVSADVRITCVFNKNDETTWNVYLVIVYTFAVTDISLDWTDTEPPSPEEVPIETIIVAFDETICGIDQHYNLQCDAIFQYTEPDEFLLPDGVPSQETAYPGYEIQTDHKPLGNTDPICCRAKEIGLTTWVNEDYGDSKTIDGYGYIYRAVTSELRVKPETDDFYWEEIPTSGETSLFDTGTVSEIGTHSTSSSKNTNCTIL